MSADKLGYDGKVVIITGAGGGLGRQHALLMASRGALVVINDLGGAVDGSGSDKGAAERVVDEIKAAGGEAVADTNSVATPEGGRAIVQTALDAYGKVDVVINNAGAAYTGSLAEMPLEQWQWLMQLNLTSVFQVCQAVLPALRLRGGGHIINVSSHAARNAFPDWGAYCAGKAALASFSRCLAEEERNHGIRVSTLTLGAVNTPLWDSATVHSSFDRRAMLAPERAAEALVSLAQQPASQIVEDITLMPAAGAL